MSFLRRFLINAAKWGFAWVLASVALMGVSMMARGWGGPGALHRFPDSVPVIVQIFLYYAQVLLYFGAIVGGLAIAATGSIFGARFLLGVRAAIDAKRVKMWTSRIEERSPGQLAIAHDADTGRVSVTGSSAHETRVR